MIEGIDHTGKETQSKILVKRLKRSGFKTSYFDFPQYKQRSAVFVEDYLTGEFGEATKLDPFVSNLFFALDRFSAKKAIKNSLNEGGVVVSNRFVSSGLAHQSGKLNSLDKKKDLWSRIRDFEFGLLGIPKPHTTFILMVPLEISLKLGGNMKKAKFISSSGKKPVLDQHEKSFSHLKNARQTYILLARHYPKEYQIIDCYDEKNKTILPIQTIHEKIWQQLLKNKKFKKIVKITTNHKSRE